MTTFDKSSLLDLCNEFDKQMFTTELGTLLASILEKGEFLLQSIDNGKSGSDQDTIIRLETNLSFLEYVIEKAESKNKNLENQI